jgi:hypothetical protein
MKLKRVRNSQPWIFNDFLLSWGALSAPQSQGKAPVRNMSSFTGVTHRLQLRQSVC